MDPRGLRDEILAPIHARIWRRALAASLPAIFVCAGCGTPPAASAKKDKKPIALSVTSPDPEHLLVKHAAGETLIPAHPKRVAAIAGADEMLLLGLRPCSFPTSWDVVRTYEREALRNSTPLTTAYGSMEPPLEPVLADEPDLILTATSVTAQTERLSAIAPTVVFGWGASGSLDDGTQRLRDVAAVLGVPERAGPVIAAYDAKLAEGKALLAARVGKESVAILRVRQRRYWVFGTWFADLLFDRLGLTPAPFVRDRLLNNKNPQDSMQMLLDPELLPLLDADHLFVIVDPMINTDRQTAALEEIPGWSDVPAVRKGNVYYVSQSNWLSNGVLIRSVSADEVISALLREDRFAAPVKTSAERRTALDVLFRDREAAVRTSLIPARLEGCDAR